MITERIITIQGLEVMAQVGVPDVERSLPQRLLIDIRFAALAQPVSLQDDLSLTTDYHAVSRRILEIVTERPRKLIETVAEEIADNVLKEYSLRWIEVTVRKFILPQTDFVAVSIRRETEPS